MALYAARMRTSVVVTGGARGIGRAIAARMVARGHAVVLTDLDAAGARRTAEELGAAAGLGHDVRDPQAHRDVAEVAAAHGRLTAWFNNAGVGHDGDLVDLTEEQIRELVEVNLLGVLWGTRTAMSAFGPAGGDIVATASLSAFGPVPGLSVYAATKAGVLSLMMSVGVEAPEGVRLHALCPDGVDTALLRSMRDDGTGKALSHSGGRILSVDEVADAAVGLVGSRRVVRSMPGWRGAVARGSALLPTVSAYSLGPMTALGRRVMARS